MLSLISSDAIRRHFFSAPLAHLVLVACRPFRTTHGTRISQRGHHGWGRLPSSNMTKVYLTCMGNKCTPSTIIVAARPRYPSTGPSCSPTAAGNNIRYIYVYPAGEGVSHYCLPIASMPCQLHQCNTINSPPLTHHSQGIVPLASVWIGR